MNSNWDIYTVAELVEQGIIEKPLDGNHGEMHPKGDDFVESGVPFIMASDIENSEVNLVSCKFITETQASTLRKGRARAGDVLLTHKATIGRTAIVPDTVRDFIMLTPQVTYYRVKDATCLNNVYLKYYFDSLPFQTLLVNWSGAGSTRAYIGITNQLELPIAIPPINLQKDMATTLAMLDHKIATNRLINKQLEKTVQAIYEYWFICPEASKKWRRGTADDLGTIVGGSTPSTKDKAHFTEQGTPWITPYDLSENLGNKYITRGRQDVTDKGIKNASLKIYPAGTVLLSSRAPIGYMAIAREQLTTNQGFKSFIPDKGYPSEYVYYAVKQLLDTVIRYSSGSTFDEISGTVLKTVGVYLPPIELAQKYASTVSAMFDKQNFLEQENQQLADLRDWLLPLLMNGQVTVNNKVAAI